MSWYNALEYWLITTVVKWGLSREQHSQRDDEEENTGSGKSIARILTGTRDPIPLVGPSNQHRYFCNLHK